MVRIRVRAGLRAWLGQLGARRVAAEAGNGGGAGGGSDRPHLSGLVARQSG
jgi:hypothetical protein